MKFINIGFGNMVAVDRMVALVSPDSAPIKRLTQEVRENGLLIDASFGRKTKAVLVMDSGHVILSSLETEKIAKRVSDEETEDEDE